MLAHACSLNGFSAFVECQIRGAEHFVCVLSCLSHEFLIFKRFDKSTFCLYLNDRTFYILSFANALLTLVPQPAIIVIVIAWWSGSNLSPRYPFTVPNAELVSYDFSFEILSETLLHSITGRTSDLLACCLILESQILTFRREKSWILFALIQIWAMYLCQRRSLDMMTSRYFMWFTRFSWCLWRKKVDCRGVLLWVMLIAPHLHVEIPSSTLFPSDKCKSDTFCNTLSSLTFFMVMRITVSYAKRLVVALTFWAILLV